MPEDPETIAHCQACNAPMDVSAVAPFSNVECPSCGEHSRVKLNFGPYTLTRRHAVGGMSMVFVALDSTLHREVAVKILSEEYSNDEKRIHAFEEEARITASFSHPNVVRVLRTGRAFGRFYIAMEFVSGGHFEHHIRERKRIPEAELLLLAIEVAQGLKAAKAAGLIHRDVKPGNILLDGEGHAKLVDFGLSLVTQGGKAKATELWATPFYVPPETVEGKEEDFRSDIYALGSTLYHALAGSPPCNEESMATRVLLKAKQEIVPLKQVAPDVSEMTCSIVHQAMAYSPNGRFSSYDELIHSLRDALKHLRKGSSLKRSNSKPRKMLWIGLAVVAAIATLAALWPDGESKHGNGDKHAQSAGSGNGRPGNSMPGTTDETIAKNFNDARDALKAGEFEKAADLFAALHDNPEVREPTRSWAGVEAVLCHYLDGNTVAARRQAANAKRHLDELDPQAPGIGRRIFQILGQLGSLPPIECHAAEGSTSQTVLAAMLGGLKNWQQGMLDPAAECFRIAASTKVAANDQWVVIYQQHASDFLADYHLLSSPLFQKLPDTPEACHKAIEELNLTIQTLKTRGRARYNLRAWQIDLARRAKTLEQKLD